MGSRSELIGGEGKESRGRRGTNERRSRREAEEKPKRVEKKRMRLLYHRGIA